MFDANGDGSISQPDVDAIQEYAAGLSSACGYMNEAGYCDLNGATGVTNVDAILLATCLDNGGEIFPVDSCQDCIGYGMCDANGDGSISQPDVDAIQEYAAGLSSACGYMNEAGYCDLNGMTNVTNADAILLAQCFIQPPEPYCGNGIIEEGETCDGTNVTQGYACSEDCMVETLIPACGDGICNGDETSATCQQDCGPVSPQPSGPSGGGGSNNGGGTNVVFPRAPAPLSAPAPEQTQPPAPVPAAPVEETQPAQVSTESGGGNTTSQGPRLSEIPAPEELPAPEAPVAAALFGDLGGLPIFALFLLAVLLLIIAVLYVAFRKKRSGK